jgi:iron complex outermembrane receptor protein
LTVNHDLAEAKWWGSELRYSMDLFSRTAEVLPRLSMVTGLEYRDAYDLHLENLDADPYFFVWADIDTDFRSLSWYLQSELELLDSLPLARSLRLVGGVRMDDRSTLDPEWNPRAALIYQPFESATLKLLYGRAFRAPNAWERDYDDGWQLRNPDLDAETISTWELVWEPRLWEHTRLVTSLFQFDLKDIITQVEIDPEEELLQYQNSGSVRSRGIEVQLETRWKNGVLGQLGFSALDTEDKDTGVRISNAPKYLVTGGVSVPIPVCSQWVYLSPELQYVGGRKTLSGAEVDSSFFGNVTLLARLFDHVDASFSVYNLFDRDNAVPGAGEHIQDRLPMDGRTYRLQLSYRY